MTPKAYSGHRLAVFATYMVLFILSAHWVESVWGVGHFSWIFAVVKLTGRRSAAPAKVACVTSGSSLRLRLRCGPTVMTNAAPSLSTGWKTHGVKNPALRGAVEAVASRGRSRSCHRSLGAAAPFVMAEYRLGYRRSRNMRWPRRSCSMVCPFCSGPILRRSAGHRLCPEEDQVPLKPCSLERATCSCRWWIIVGSSGLMATRPRLMRPLCGIISVRAGRGIGRKRHALRYRGQHRLMRLRVGARNVWRLRRRCLCGHASVGVESTLPALD